MWAVCIRLHCCISQDTSAIQLCKFYYNLRKEGIWIRRRTVSKRTEERSCDWCKIKLNQFEFLIFRANFPGDQIQNPLLFSSVSFKKLISLFFASLSSQVRQKDVSVFFAEYKESVCLTKVLLEMPHAANNLYNYSSSTKYAASSYWESKSLKTFFLNCGCVMV